MTLEKLAEERARLHEGQGHTWGDNVQEIGLAGEIAFSQWAQVPADLEAKPQGDGGVDALIFLGFTVDVKTSPKAGLLLVKKDSIKADIYVLAKYKDGGRAILLGWEWGASVKAAKLTDMGNRGVESHTIPRADLRPMTELGKRLQNICVGL